MDYNIKLSNGQLLRGLIRKPEKSNAVIIMVHGHGEHIQRYNHWAELFYEKNIGFTGVDLPGHGRSDGKRGHIQKGSLFDEMLDILINECKKTFPDLPVFVYGHSLGGAIILAYLLRRNPKIAGAIITSPTLRLAFEPSKAKLKLAAIMKNILPGLIQQSGLPVEYLSHDKEIVEKYINDPLVHGKISVNLFHTLMNLANYSLSHASELKTPVLLIHGDNDKICSPAGSIEFAGKTQMAELKIWPGGYHELHNEPFKNDVFKFILNWINLKLT
ncbi:MAG: lysophospholipase [Bacteroidia bacterium]|nr:lysophospholipase [Bacteroidia bacterium]